MSQNSDKDIVDLLKVDGSKAIEVLFRKYYKDLCIIANRYIKDQNHSEDLVQELIFDIWKKRETLVINSSLGSYLRKSVVNRSLNHIRSRKVVFEPDDEIQNLTKLSDDNIQANIETEELEKYIDACIDELPEKCRLVFIMSRFDQLSYKEIGQKLDISTKTVENQISKALKHLRLRLESRKKNI